MLLQIGVILLVSYACGTVLRRLGQPSVIGEILAGIFLGPTLLGAVSPETQAFLFPANSLPRLNFLSQVGLLLFMFIVGLELNLKLLRSSVKAVVMISHLSIGIPFVLGAFLARGLYEKYAPSGVDFTSFALFVGIALSITAFPVLARMLREQKLERTPLGATAISCAAVDDVTAWCVLAVIVGVVRSGSAMQALPVIGFSVVYVAAVIYGIRPLLRRAFAPTIRAGKISVPAWLSVFALMTGSAFVTDAIGIHGLFGAFLMGVVMPQDPKFRQTIIARTQGVCTRVFLPLFFAYTGLRTQIYLLNDAHAWSVCALIVAAAVTGKLGGGLFAARLSGFSWRESWALGALMNTRGLMELVALNLGYELGILSAELFAMMVVMALITTAMTGPLIRLCGFWEPNVHPELHPDLRVDLRAELQAAEAQ